MIHPTLNLRNNVLIEFLSENFLVFLIIYQKVPQASHSEKEILIIAKKENIGTVAKRA